MLRRSRVFGILLAAAVAAGACGGAAGARAPVRSSISILRQGEVFLVDAVLIAPVSRREAWAVLTDFDHMSAFVPGVNESRVLRGPGTG